MIMFDVMNDVENSILPFPAQRYSLCLLTSHEVLFQTLVSGTWQSPEQFSSYTFDIIAKRILATCDDYFGSAKKSTQMAKIPPSII